MAPQSNVLSAARRSYSQRRTHRRRRHHKPRRTDMPITKRVYKRPVQAKPYKNTVIKRTVNFVAQPTIKPNPTALSLYRRRNRQHRSFTKHISHLMGNDRQLLPDRFTTKMVYAALIEKHELTTGIAWDIFMNSVYNPQLGSALSCEGLAQLQPFYNQFRVDGVELIVEGQNLSDNTPCVMFIGSTNRTEWAGPASGFPHGLTQVARDAEADRGIYTYVIGESKPFRIRKYFSFAEAEGIPKQEYQTNADYWGNMTATSAARPAYLPIVFAGGMSADQTTSTFMWYITRCVYYVTFFGVNQITHPTAFSKLPVIPPKPDTVVVSHHCESQSESEGDTDLETITKSQIVKIKELIKKK